MLLREQREKIDRRGYRTISFTDVVEAVVASHVCFLQDLMYVMFKLGMGDIDSKEELEDSGTCLFSFFFFSHGRTDIQAFEC